MITLTPEDIERQIKHCRASMIKRIRQMAKPHLYQSGYVKRNRDVTKPAQNLFLVLLKTPIEFGDETECEAITEHGISTDSYGGGIVTQNYRHVPTDHLLAILKQLPAHLPAKKD